MDKVVENSGVAIFQLEKSIVVIDKKVETISIFSEKDVNIALNISDINTIQEELTKGSKSFQLENGYINILAEDNLISINNVLLKVEEFNELSDYLNNYSTQKNKSKSIYERLIYDTDSEEIKNEKNK